MKRIIVIGSPGAGKSTFARQLRDITGLPLYYLDMIWHLPDRTTITKDEFDQKLMDILKTDTWIIDFPETKLPQIYGLLEQYGLGKEIHIFRSREDANKYLESI